jgi:hypothetical protein
MEAGRAGSTGAEEAGFDCDVVVVVAADEGVSEATGPAQY